MHVPFFTDAVTPDAHSTGLQLLNRSVTAQLDEKSATASICFYNVQQTTLSCSCQIVRLAAQAVRLISSSVIGLFKHEVTARPIATYHARDWATWLLTSILPPFLDSRHSCGAKAIGCLGSCQHIG
eukprot:2834378-Pleurochrysis_carterae.AAC.2